MNMANERLSRVETDIKYLREGQDELKGMINGFIQKADKRYANKIVETIVYALVGLIVVGVLGALLSKVIV